MAKHRIYELEGLQLHHPLAVLIEKHPNEVVVKQPDLELFAVGKTLPEAITQLKIEILDLRDELGEMSLVEMGAKPQEWKRVLDKIAAQSVPQSSVDVHNTSDTML